MKPRAPVTRTLGIAFNILRFYSFEKQNAGSEGQGDSWLLSPKHFGLVAMAAAFTGALPWFRGLSAAAVQRATITDEQTSTLFWINLTFGVLLGLVALVMAPVIFTFYHEPQQPALSQHHMTLRYHLHGQPRTASG
jgi:hypothetical protein